MKVTLEEKRLMQSFAPFEFKSSEFNSLYPLFSLAVKCSSLAGQAMLDEWDSLFDEYLFNSDMNVLNLESLKREVVAFIKFYNKNRDEINKSLIV